MVVIGILGAVGPLFIVLLLFDQTRGFFEGWVRALVAAGLAGLSTWTLALLMTTVLEPWLVTLAQQRELAMLEPQPAMTASSIVLAFTAAQLAMIAGSAVIAFGFRLISPLRLAPAAQPAGRTTQTTESATSIAMVPRASLLADQLRRFDSVIEGRARAVAASVRMVSPEPFAEPQLAGAGAYRRATPSRDHLGRRGTRR
jgi:type IV secretion system protein VirB6